MARSGLVIVVLLALFVVATTPEGSPVDGGEERLEPEVRTARAGAGETGTQEPGEASGGGEGHELRVYDLFLTPEGMAPGAPCRAVGAMSTIAEGSTLELWDSGRASVIGGGELGAGQVVYDDSGPVRGEPQHHLFYYCSFDVPLAGLPLSGQVRVSYPGGAEPGPVTEAGHLAAGSFTTFVDTQREEERDRIRAGLEAGG